MMRHANDSRAIRNRQAVATAALDRSADREPDASAAMLAQTTTVTTYPTAAASFFAVLPCDISGDETEGATATYVPSDTVPQYAWNAGTQVPPSGTTVVCHAVGGRWVFRYNG